MSNESMKIIISSDVAKGVQGINTVNTGLNSIAPAAAKANAALIKINPGANQAGNALNNLSRIAQDAPFGFLGISNNINPLLESFQRLKTETGSSGAALKALGASLAGAGGLGLLVGVGSALLTVFGDKLFGMGAAAKKAKDETEELKKSIRDIALVSGEGAASAQGDIAQVNALAAAVGDSNKPYEERKRALTELQGINKAYFGDLKLEDAATGKLTGTVQEYTKALIASAITKKFVDEIANVAKSASEADVKLAKSKTSLTHAQQELNNANAKAATIVVGQQGTAKTSEQIKAQNKLTEATIANRSASELVTDLLSQQAVLTDQLNKSVEQGLKFKDLQTDKEKKEVDLLSKRLAALEKIKDVTVDLTQLANLEEQIFDLKVKITLRDAAKNGLSKQETDAAIAGFRKQLSEAFLKEAISLEGIPKIKFSDVIKVEIPDNINFIVSNAGQVFTKLNNEISKATGFDKKIPELTLHEVRIKLLGVTLTNAVEEAEKAAKHMQEVIINAFTGAFTGTADALGQALGDIFSGDSLGKTFARFGENILKIIGSVISDLGKEIALASTLIQNLKKTLGTQGLGATSFGLGLALIVLGGLLKNFKFGGIQGFAEGGVSKGPRSGYLALLHGEELIIPMSKIRAGNTTGVQGAGLANISLQPSVQIQGQALRILLNRVDATGGRLY